MLSNFLYQVGYQILALILPLITIPYTSRVLGAEGIGTYSYSFAVVSYFVSFANMGITNFGNREVAAVRNDRVKRSQLFWDLFVLQLLFSLCAILMYVGMIVCGTWEDKLIFLIQGIYIIGQALDINWFFFGMEKFKITVMRNMLVKVISTLLIFGLIKEPEDLAKYIIILALGTVIGNSAVWVFIKEYIVWRRPNFENIKKCVRPVVILLLPSFAVKIYTQMDKVFIKLFSGVVQVGYYENAEKIISIAFVLVSALSTILLPRMANLYANREKEKFRELFHKSISIVCWLTVALMFGVMGIADNFVNVYLGADYLSCIAILIVLSVTIPFKGIAEIVRRGYIIPTKCDSIFVISIFIGAGVNVIINLLLIPQYGAVGAAAGTVMAEFTVFAIQVWKIRKRIEMLSFLRENLSCIFAGGIMLICIRKISEKMGDLSLLAIVCLQIVTGVLVYVLITGVIYVVRKRKILMKRKCRKR